VSAASPQRQPEPPSPERHPKPHIYTLEATGVLIIAVLILIITLARYWHSISWSAR
jgi:hypothetical protein